MGIWKIINTRDFAMFFFFCFLLGCHFTFKHSRSNVYLLPDMICSGCCDCELKWNSLPSSFFLFFIFSFVVIRQIHYICIDLMLFFSFLFPRFDNISFSECLENESNDANDGICFFFCSSKIAWLMKNYDFDK